MVRGDGALACFGALPLDPVQLRGKREQVIVFALDASVKALSAAPPEARPS